MTMQPTTLEEFIDLLLQEKQFQGLEPEVYQELKQDLVSRAEDHINTALLNNLSEQDLSDFQKMLDDDVDIEALQAFLQAHVPHIEEIVASTLLLFRNGYISEQ